MSGCRNPGNSCQTNWCLPENCYNQCTVGKPAPNFECAAFVDMDFKTIKKSDYLGKYLVVVFYPCDFTFVCPTELVAFNDLLATFRENNCEVIGVSCDSQHVHMNYVMTPRKKGGLGEEFVMPLLADNTKCFSKTYGCLIEEGPDAGFAFRATYIIDDKGILRHMTVGDLPVGRNPDETLRLVQAFQYSDVHGSVCPSKWKKAGDAVMKGDHKAEETKKYFANEHSK